MHTLLTTLKKKMIKMKIPNGVVCVFLFVVMLVGDQTQVAMEEVTYGALDLSACASASAITLASPPSAECCSKLKE